MLFSLVVTGYTGEQCYELRRGKKIRPQIGKSLYSTNASVAREEPFKLLAL